VQQSLNLVGKRNQVAAAVGAAFNMMIYLNALEPFRAKLGHPQVQHFDISSQLELGWQSGESSIQIPAPSHPAIVVPSPPGRQLDEGQKGEHILLGGVHQSCVILSQLATQNPTRFDDPHLQGALHG